LRAMEKINIDTRKTSEFLFLSFMLLNIFYTQQIYKGITSYTYWYASKTP